ncbi:MAG: transporter substrate-binding domain-containing protein [Lachnospiraceae bacterium]|nr:transporter substrate-binding domain-containing protein [Lachnospiraceae bacterium]
MRTKPRLWVIPMAIVIGLMLVSCGMKKDTAQESEGAFTTLNELQDKTIGIQTGTNFDALTAKQLPNAKFEYFNSLPDLVGALKTGKIDAFPGDEPQLLVTMKEEPSVTILDERLDHFDFGFIFPKDGKGDALRDEFNAFLEMVKADGTLEKIRNVWFDDDESKQVPSGYEDLPATNGTLVLATEGAYPPFNFYKNNKVVGLDVDLATLFCKEYGYGLHVEVMSLDATIPAVKTGKVNFAASGITITSERAESVNFSDPYFSGGTVMAVLKADAAAGGNPIEQIKASFEKTFIKEDRYVLFAQGIGVTLFITVLSVIFGTALGFVVFMWCRKGKRFANTVTNFMIWLIQGMPMVVLLMILYYIVFGKSSIEGEWVAVIGFSLTFGAAVFGMLKAGVDAVDRGQTEAAYALGFTDRQTFFEIVLPQAARFFMGSYRGEIVSLIKSTAIVGYIAVQDLTKMGDIVRSRTYEAFFPIISVAVFYFILAALLTTIVKWLTAGVDPRKNKEKKFLKGVKTHD